MNIDSVLYRLMWYMPFVSIFSHKKTETELLDLYLAKMRCESNKELADEIEKIRTHFKNLNK